MKRFLEYNVYLFLRLALSLRYRLRVVGKKSLTSKKKGGMLFLANHPAEIDPCILLTTLWYPFKIHPVAVEYLFRIPVVRNLLDFVGALSVPSFTAFANSYKKRQVEKTYQKIYSLLEKGENVLIYPAGGLKQTASEVIGGASGVHTILGMRPETEVVLVRTKGLWGSTFSRAPTGKTPDLFSTFLGGFKVLLKNGLFFAPRREVIVECVLAPNDFPRRGSRLELNRFLENWYNREGPEPLKLVSFSHFRKVYPQIYQPPKEEQIVFESIPKETKESIFNEIAQLARIPAEELSYESHLALDLGLDSLDISQLVMVLKENYGVGTIQLSDLKTVGSVLAFAARLKQSEGAEEEEVSSLLVWEKEKGRPAAHYAEGSTLTEAFLNSCARMDGFTACVDQISGEVCYRQLKLVVVLLAQAIRKLPGSHIGVMMPASTAVNAIVFAVLLAGKVPVMINWTLGERNLRSIVEQSGIQVTLSSWKFLDRLENVDLNGLDDQILLMEELRRNLTLFDKVRAFYRARKKTSALLKIFGVHKVSSEETAVILFTSGTETFPKGVPLSHGNLIANQRGAKQLVDIRSEDIMLGVLPPFHSFGFSVTGIFPLLAGLRAAYSPNPTDGRRIASAIERWKITLVCLAPTFLKNVLRVASPKQLKSLRLVVTGAEKTALELFEKLAELNPEAQLIEGYGITECAPILTLNPPGHTQKGVGVPLPGIEIAVVHPENYESVPKGETGLILVRGPNVFNGYLNPKLTPFVDFQSKTWYQTGDLGYLNEEGYLNLSGRLKRFIKIGGEMVSLAALEEALLQSASRLGWQLDPDRPSLAICPLEEEGKKSEIHLFTTFETKAEEVNLALRESGMSNLLKVRSVHKLPFIPLLGSGKVDYRKLGEKLRTRRVHV